MSSSSALDHFAMNTIFSVFIFFDISQSRAVGHVQPNMKMFPRTEQGQADKRRAFNSTQYREYPWIEYSVIVFFFTPLCCSGLAIHSTLEHQGCAMLAWPEYKKGAKSNTSLM